MRAKVRPPPRDCEEPSAVEQELQSLSYRVAHDLAASVRHISSFSRLLVSDLAGQLTLRQQTFADQIGAAGEHSSAMLDQLLVYSQIQQRELSRTLHDPTPGVRTAWLRQAANVEAAAGEISIGPLGAIYADADLVARAMAAALDNAIKFRRLGVALRVVVEPGHDRAFWRLRVRDNGVGVEPQLREPAFCMFRRLNVAGAYPGVGAGLAICRRIARRHGGEARFVESLEGACFELALPRVGGAGRRQGGAAP